MSEVSIAPDVSALEVPMDAWTQPFWDGTAEKKLLLPRCSSCHRFRWRRDRSVRIANHS